MKKVLFRLCRINRYYKALKSQVDNDFVHVHTKENQILQKRIDKYKRYVPLFLLKPIDMLIERYYEKKFRTIHK